MSSADQLLNWVADIQNIGHIFCLVYISRGRQQFLGTSDIMSDVKKLHVRHLESTSDILIFK